MHVCLFFEIRNIFWYIFDYADRWVKKIVHPANFQKQEYLFFLMQTKQKCELCQNEIPSIQKPGKPLIEKCCDFAWNLSENILLKNIFDSIHHYHDVIKKAPFFARTDNFYKYVQIRYLICVENMEWLKM